MMMYVVSARRVVGTGVNGNSCDRILNVCVRACRGTVGCGYEASGGPVSRASCSRIRRREERWSVIPGYPARDSGVPNPRTSTRRSSEQ